MSSRPVVKYKLHTAQVKRQAMRPKKRHQPPSSVVKQRVSVRRFWPFEQIHVHGFCLYSKRSVRGLPFTVNVNRKASIIMCNPSFAMPNSYFLSELQQAKPVLNQA